MINVTDDERKILRKALIALRRDNPFFKRVKLSKHDIEWDSDDAKELVVIDDLILSYFTLVE